MPKVRTKKKPEEAPRGTPSYMLTYGDMTTLLLVFFIAMFKLGDAVSDAKSMAALMSFRDGVGVMDGSISVMRPDEVLLMPQTPGDAAGALFGTGENLSIETIREAVGKLEDEGKGNNGVWSLDEGALKVRLGSQALFQSGDAAVLEQAKTELSKIAQLAKQYNLEITVEGHTDDRPISTPLFPDNWSLSSARANNVLRYMQEAGQLDPQLMHSEGRSYFDPMCDTTADPTEGCYQKNRRVEILLMPTINTPKEVDVKDIQNIFNPEAANQEPRFPSEE